MTSSSPHEVWYVYGIVPATGAVPVASPVPAGLDDREVALESCDGLAAMASVLDGGEYAAAAVETKSGDVEWLSPRAMAHDRVLTWASDHGVVVPLPMFSLFSGRGAVQEMLRERAPQLAKTLARVGQGREYALRVYRVDSELLAAVTTLSPRLKQMADAAAAAAPGQRYLLERKLEAEKKSGLRGVSQGIVDEIMGALQPETLEHVRSAIPRVSEADSRGTMVLNAAFLVAPSSLQDFQRTLTTLVEAHGAHGFRFDFTGPWPPYHFVSADADDA